MNSSRTVSEDEDLQETEYLLRSSANARRLLRSYLEATDSLVKQASAVDERNIAASRLSQ